MKIESGRKTLRNSSELDSIFFIFYFFGSFFPDHLFGFFFVDAIFAFKCHIRWYSVVEFSVYDFGRLRDMSTEFSSKH